MIQNPTKRGEGITRHQRSERKTREGDQRWRKARARILKRDTAANDRNQPPAYEQRSNLPKDHGAPEEGIKEPNKKSNAVHAPRNTPVLEEKEKTQKQATRFCG